MPGLQNKYEISLTDEQARELTHLSLSYSERFDDVERARIILLAHQNPKWSMKRLAQELGCSLATVKKWKRRWKDELNLLSKPRCGRGRTFTALQRAQITALACANPSESGKAYKRWSCKKLKDVAIEKQIVEHSKCKHHKTLVA